MNIRNWFLCISIFALLAGCSSKTGHQNKSVKEEVIDDLEDNASMTIDSGRNGWIVHKLQG